MRIADVGGPSLGSGEDVHAPPVAGSAYASDWAATPAPTATRAAPTAPAAADAKGEAARLESARVHAALADDVYDDTPHPPAGWRVADDAELAKLHLDSKLMEDGRGFRARLYEGPGGAQVVAFRGSSTREDWINDARQAGGLPTSSYRAALAVGRAVALSSDRDGVSFTGHSLGGGLASTAAVASGRPADTFNASGLSRPTLAQALSINSGAHAGGPGRVEAYYVRGEVLSTLQDGGDRVVGSVLGGLFGPAGAALGAGVDAPSAYGQRIALDEVAPAGAGFLKAHDPVAMHGMGWVERGLDKAVAQAGR